MPTRNRALGESNSRISTISLLPTRHWLGELHVNESETPDLFEAAARATINERCASAYLHDVRGSMQALFSAVELLGRSALSGGVNVVRAEKACELARRAISHHEKATLDVLQLLTLQHAQATEVDVGLLIKEVVHFLRNEAASRSVVVKLSNAAQLRVVAERAKLQTLLVGLITAAIDETPSGEALPISVERYAGEAIITIGCNAEYGHAPGDDRWPNRLSDVFGPPELTLDSRELTIGFARRYLSANQGRLEIDAGAQPRGAMRLHYPCIVSVPA